MKSVILPFFLLMCFHSLHAQFMATKDGLVTLDESPFYVVSIEGKSAKELYQSTKSFILTKFRNPDAVTNSIDGEMINLHGYFEDAFPCQKWFGTHFADVDMNLVMYFKDGKIRFDIPSLNSMRCNTLKDAMGTAPYREVVFVSGGAIKMFDKKGKVKNEMAVNGLNSFINEFIGEIIEYNKQQTNNDW